MNNNTDTEHHHPLRAIAAGLRLAGLRGQTSVEYAVLIAIIVGALLVMQIYVKRGFSGRLRASADSLGEQYHPRQTTSEMTFTITSNTTTSQQLERDHDVGGGQIADVMITTTVINEGGDSTSRSGTESVGALGTDLWE